MIQVVFIDIDNTLLDFDAYVQQSLQSGFEKFGLGEYKPYMFEIFVRINDTLWQRIEKGLLRFEDLQYVRFQLLFKVIGIDFDGRKFEHYFVDCIRESAIPMPGAKELLAYLSEKYTVCAASNGPYEQQVHRIKLGGLYPYFDDFFISERVGVSKPAKSFFERSLMLLNENREESVAAENCVMIGDSLRSDIAGGKEAGFGTIWYNAKQQKLPRDMQPDSTVQHLEQIKDIL